MLYAERDDREAEGFPAEELAAYLRRGLGADVVDLRLWREWEAGVALSEREVFLEQAQLVISFLSIDYLNDRDLMALHARLPVLHQRTGQRQVAVLFKPCPYEHDPYLSTIEVLPGAAQAVVNHKGDRSEVWNGIARKVAELMGRPVAPKKSGTDGAQSAVFACDRVEQMEAFERGRAVVMRPPRFYFLHGTEEQSHRGFITRMQLDLTGRLTAHQQRDIRCNLHQLPFPANGDPEMAKLKLLRLFHDRFGLNADDRKPLDAQRLGQMLRESNATSILADRDLILLQVTVNDFDFEQRHKTAEVIRWANQHFFDRTAFEQGAPEVIVLWCLVYTGDGDDEDDFEDYRKRWADLANSEPQWLLLPELGPVHRRDVKRWMQEFAPDLDPVAQDERMNAHFRDSKTLDMVRVERMLTQIMQEGNG